MLTLIVHSSKYYFNNVYRHAVILDSHILFHFDIQNYTITISSIRTLLNLLHGNKHRMESLLHKT